MRIHIHPSLYIYLSGVAALSSLQACLAMLLALLIHEVSHLVVCRLVGERIELLELTPVGGVITRKRGTAAHKGIRGVFVHAAGPLGNYAMLLLSGIDVVQQFLEPSLLRNIIVTNASMLLLNLIPALPLDGAQMIFSIGYYFFPVARLVFALSALGIVTGISGFLLALYGIAFERILNCSLLIISIYLIVSAKRASNTLLTENILTIVQERMHDMSNIRRIEHYRVSADTLLYELIPCLKHNANVCFSFLREGKANVLEEEAFCCALLKTPSLSISHAYADWTEMQRKK
ncbi:MAG: hypothetical protein E7321_02200 [Clostridiales bacterium]|nr:hypothetical protein [Clostridiales bacterium]